MKDLKDRMAAGQEVLWINRQVGDPSKKLDLSKKDIDDAEARLSRFAPYIAKAFPETKASHGLIESPIVKVPNFGKHLKLKHPLFLKLDSQLPISGSVKARGGIYEVLKFAEKVAMDNGMLSLEDDYSILTQAAFKKLFSNYRVSVGSTGNLGLSIGIISAKLGFDVTVHMSADAKKWKKDLLRKKGALVIEYPDSYEKAVGQGRRLAEQDPKCHFVDDENSLDLFLGYSVAGKRLVDQLDKAGIIVDEDHPLYVYIPCGVGGAPGGIAFGIKQYLADNAHVYFAEPVQAPCMTLGLLTGLHDKIAVEDIGLTGKTIADGLAVGRASKLVSKMMDGILDGSYTVKDERLPSLLKKLYEVEGIFIEPSACASFPGLNLIDSQIPANASHLCWATGGSMVPEEERREYLR